MDRARGDSCELEPLSPYIGVCRSAAAGSVDLSGGREDKTLDGNDVEASWFALKKAIDYVRTERKPYLLEAMVSRLNGHSSTSGANFVKDEVDCLARFETKLEERKLRTRSEMDEMRARYSEELLEASKRVREEPQPAGESIWDYVFAEKNYVAGES